VNWWGEVNVFVGGRGVIEGWHVKYIKPCFVSDSFALDCQSLRVNVVK
jgi:hypothetical protein